VLKIEKCAIAFSTSRQQIGHERAKQEDNRAIKTVCAMTFEKIVRATSTFLA